MSPTFGLLCDRYLDHRRDRTGTRSPVRGIVLAALATETASSMEAWKTHTGDKIALTRGRRLRAFRRFCLRHGWTRLEGRLWRFGTRRGWNSNS